MEIHRLPEDKEQELVARIAGTIYADKDIKPPEINKKTEAKPKMLKYSPHIQKLVDEHVLIKRWIALIPQVVENIDLEGEVLQEEWATV